MHKILSVLVIVLTFFVLSSLSLVYARGTDELMPLLEGIETFTPEIQQIQTKTQDGVLIRGVRYKNEGGPRIVLIHGFSGNTRNWREFARVANKQGYDIWMYNFRGHGNGSHKSKHPRIPTNDSAKSKGFYGLDKIITQDIPAIIEQAYDGRPLIFMGHSLGGLALRQFLSGVREGRNGVFVSRDSRRLNKYIKKVQALITIGSPTSFDQQDDIRFKLMAELPKSFLNMMINPVVRKNAPTQNPTTWLGKTNEYMADTFKDVFHQSYVGDMIFSGLVNKQNIKTGIEENELGRLMSKGVSIVPEDLIEDAQRWAKKGLESRNGVSYTGMAVPSQLNFYQIVGTLDKLVQVQDIIREHEMFSITFEPRVIAFKNFSHIDLAVGYGAAPILYKIMERIYEKSDFSIELKSITRGLNQVEILKPKIKVICSRIF